MPELPSRGRLQESLRPPAQSESAEPEVGIFAEAHIVKRLERVAVETAHRPVTAAGHVNGPIRCYVGHALRAYKVSRLPRMRRRDERPPDTRGR